MRFDMSNHLRGALSVCLYDMLCARFCVEDDMDALVEFTRSLWMEPLSKVRTKDEDSRRCLRRGFAWKKTQSRSDNSRYFGGHIKIDHIYKMIFTFYSRLWLIQIILKENSFILHYVRRLEDKKARRIRNSNPTRLICLFKKRSASVLMAHIVMELYKNTKRRSRFIFSSKSKKGHKRAHEYRLFQSRMLELFFFFFYYYPFCRVEEFSHDHVCKYVILRPCCLQFSLGRLQIWLVGDDGRMRRMIEIKLSQNVGSCW